MNNSKPIVQDVKRILLTGWTLIAISFVMLAQGKRPLADFMQSAGFQKTTSNEWKNDKGAVVLMDSDYVLGFTAPQVHNWKLVFGDGTTFGKTINIKSGDVVTFENGIIKFGNSATVKLLSKDENIKTSRGLVKSAIFNPSRDILNITDIKIINAEEYSIGWLNCTGQPEDENALDQNGNLVKLVVAHQEAEKTKRDKINRDFEKAKSDLEAKRQNAIIEKYEEYCRKYGKQKIDNTLCGEIVVGVPWDLTKKAIYTYSYEKESEGPSSIWYKLSPIVWEVRAWNAIYHVQVNKSTGLIDYFYKSHKWYSK